MAKQTMVETTPNNSIDLNKFHYFLLGLKLD